VTKVGVDWNQFSYEFSWILPNDTGAGNILTRALVPAPVDRYTLQQTWTLSSEGFASIQESVEMFPM